MALVPAVRRFMTVRHAKAMNSCTPPRVKKEYSARLYAASRMTGSSVSAFQRSREMHCTL